MIVPRAVKVALGLLTLPVITLLACACGGAGSESADSSDWLPRATQSTENMNTGRLAGILIKVDHCLYVDEEGARFLLVFPISPSAASFDDATGTLLLFGASMRPGQTLSLAGGGGPLTVGASPNFVRPPDKSCDARVVWSVVGLA